CGRPDFPCGVGAPGIPASCLLMLLALLLKVAWMRASLALRSWRRSRTKSASDGRVSNAGMVRSFRLEGCVRAKRGWRAGRSASLPREAGALPRLRPLCPLPAAGELARLLEPTI